MSLDSKNAYNFIATWGSCILDISIAIATRDQTRNGVAYKLSKINFSINFEVKLVPKFCWRFAKIKIPIFAQMKCAKICPRDNLYELRCVLGIGHSLLRFYQLEAFFRLKYFFAPLLNTFKLVQNFSRIPIILLQWKFSFWKPLEISSKNFTDLKYL